MSSPGSSPAPPKAAHTIRTFTPGTYTRRVTRRTKTKDIGFAHRYFAAAPEDSRFYFRALGIRGGGGEIPPADGLPGGPPRGGETAAREAPEDILSYGGSHQDQLQGLLAVLAT